MMLAERAAARWTRAARRGAQQEVRGERLPTMAELEAQFAAVPIDPRTGYPAGFLGFALELEARGG